MDRELFDVGPTARILIGGHVESSAQDELGVAIGHVELRSRNVEGHADELLDAMAREKNRRRPRRLRER
ncbi:MAG TPA: hypothetical protein VII82_15525 [Polyangiaceae bacterium]